MSEKMTRVSSELLIELRDHYYHEPNPWPQFFSDEVATDDFRRRTACRRED